jgi:hypothetical protein
MDHLYCRNLSPASSCRAPLSHCPSLSWIFRRLIPELDHQTLQPRFFIGAGDASGMPSPAASASSGRGTAGARDISPFGSTVVVAGGTEYTKRIHTRWKANLRLRNQPQRTGGGGHHRRR